MKAIAFTSKGQPIGRLRLVSSKESSSAHIALVAEIEGEITAALIFPCSQSGIEITEAMRWRSDPGTRAASQLNPPFSREQLSGSSSSALLKTRGRIGVPRKMTDLLRGELGEEGLFHVFYPERVSPVLDKIHGTARRHGGFSLEPGLEESGSSPKGPARDGLALSALFCPRGREWLVPAFMLRADRKQGKEIVMRIPAGGRGRPERTLRFDRPSAGSSSLAWLLERLVARLDADPRRCAYCVWLAPVELAVEETFRPVVRGHPALRLPWVKVEMDVGVEPKPGKILVSTEKSLRSVFGEPDIPHGGDSLPSAPAPRLRTAAYMPETAAAPAGSEEGEALLMDPFIVEAAEDEPEEPDMRQLRARVFEASTPPVDAGFFKPSAEYLVRVQIAIRAEEDKRWLDSGVRIPPNILPPSPEGHTLMVIFSDPTYCPVPSIGSIHLPPKGDSTTFDFRLKLDASLRSVCSSILVLYQNRILCSATLLGAVGSESGFAFLPSAQINPNLADLDGPKAFDSAFYVHSGDSGRTQAIKIVNDKAVLIDLDEAEKLQDLVTKRFARARWASTAFSKIDSQGTTDLLRYLARHGSMLHRNLTKDQEGGEVLKQGGRFQVVAREREARLPLEFCYDAPSPKPSASLCPMAREALRSGTCASCPGKNADIICPLAFWGLNRVIEWHLFRREAKEELTDNEFALQQGSDALRHELPKPRNALFAASSRVDMVDKTSTKSVADELAKALPSATLAKDWTEWKKQVALASPSLLLLLPHTEKGEADDDVISLEIGSDLLGVDRIDESIVKAKPEAAPPIVFLLGCDTAVSNLSYESAISCFRYGGAAIVVSTLSPILGRQASRIAVEFIRQLSQIEPGKSRTFGEILVAVRRALLLESIPVVLSIVAYGDADWRLT